MMTRMNTMMKGLTDDVAAKHAEQMATQSSDFDMKIQDLRKISTKGFLKEMASFLVIFLNKILLKFHEIIMLYIFLSL
ncbi:DUF6277 family protein [Acetobacter thailandicus]|uniref:DUF6277 family protein n=1 Tax=Acetobacter thailandicus TaxID=1502842 RepID=UPI0038D040CD